MQIISCQAALGSRGSILQEGAVSALSMMAFQQWHSAKGSVSPTRPYNTASTVALVTPYYFVDARTRK